jgi:uncharacterized damage-inducible protein DinB
VEDALARVFAHNHWANLRLLDACAALSADVLDARPDAGWSIRQALHHLVESEQGYLALLTATRQPPLPDRALDALRAAAAASGEGLVALARDPSLPGRLERRLRTGDGYLVDPWVVIVQAVNHGADHRRQVAAMLRSRGLTVPRLDGWGFGEAVDAVVPVG